MNKAGLPGKNRLQGENDYGQGGIWYGLFLAPKIKNCLTEINLKIQTNTGLLKALLAYQKTSIEKNSLISQMVVN